MPIINRNPGRASKKIDSPGHGQGHRDPPMAMVKVVSKGKMKEIRDHLRRWSAAWDPDILRDYEHKIL